MIQLTLQYMSDQLALENQVCFPIYALAREIVNHYRPFLDELDITYPQYLVLLVLWKETELAVGQLGERVFLDTGTLTPLLKRMQQKELVSRQRSTQDERIVMVSLTPKGIKLKEQACSIPQKLMESMQVTPEELNLLKEVVCLILNKQK